MCALVQQDLSGGAAVLVYLLDVGKCVERARGRIAVEAHFIEPGNEQVAALAIFFAARGNLRLGRGERLNHRVLNGRGDAVGGVENDLAQGGHERFFGNSVPGAPAGHGIRLRKREAVMVRSAIPGSDAMETCSPS